MTAHAVPMPEHPAPPACACGWAAPLPLAVTWTAWERVVTDHLAAYEPAAGERLCPLCGRWVHKLGLGSHRRHMHRKATP